jgi:uncharacterized protein YukE
MTSYRMRAYVLVLLTESQAHKALLSALRQSCAWPGSMWAGHARKQSTGLAGCRPTRTTPTCSSAQTQLQHGWRAHGLPGWQGCGGWRTLRRGGACMGGRGPRAAAGRGARRGMAAGGARDGRAARAGAAARRRPATARGGAGEGRASAHMSACPLSHACGWLWATCGSTSGASTRERCMHQPARPSLQSPPLRRPCRRWEQPMPEHLDLRTHADVSHFIRPDKWRPCWQAPDAALAPTRGEACAPSRRYGTRSLCTAGCQVDCVHCAPAQAAAIHWSEPRVAARAQVAALLGELRAEQARLRGEFARQAAAVHALQAAVAGARRCACQRLAVPHDPCSAPPARHAPTVLCAGRN